MYTKDILFICGGAFLDLEKAIVDRCNTFVFDFDLIISNLSPDDKIHRLVLEHLSPCQHG